MIQEVKLLLW